MHKSGKITVGVLFGGRSAEHEISLLSAKSVIEALDKNRYEIVAIGIEKDGQWYITEVANIVLHAENPRLLRLNKSDDPVIFKTTKSGCAVVGLKSGSELAHLDIIFPVLHGTCGEDGAVQGLFKLIDLPFVGAGILGSAVGMDKDVTKRLLRDAGIKVANFVVFQLHQREQIVYDNILSELGSPVFIKPANLGSSVGVSKAKSKDEFEAAVKEAFEYDTKILIESFVRGREVECAVLGNENPIASLPGEVVPNHEFYSYSAKYVDAQGARYYIPADLPPEIIKKIQETSIRAYKALSCEGMGRFDSFLTESGDVLVNEINTIPGFTKISMYPKLWEVSGITREDLINRLIDLGFERYRRERNLKRSYTTKSSI